ncbi:uncharacterized protein PRCAT00004741001 [Priceomyces carsonii]|uniref:uncharacterized protein n=1 Tax=Priceomyces carsonii TaxID=28549 RepID=UPI002EDA2379|nr:unnamed protein product [Priceomyces carsonii]
MSQTVLVTGGTGYVGSHCILQLLENGFTVRTTVRNEDKGEALVKALDKIVSKSDNKSPNKLTIFRANLDLDEGWNDAISGCTFVLHVASPFSDVATLSKEIAIETAKNGALRVLKLAHKHKVKRVVLTSSAGTVTFGHKEQKLLDDDSWSVSENIDSIYILSKIASEKACWDFISSEENKRSQPALELSVLNPAFILGPCIPGYGVASTSITIIKAIIDGTLSRGAFKVYFSTVDVRDVAKIHIQAMTNSKAKDNRFLLCSYLNAVSLMNIADTFRFKIPAEFNKNIPNREIPYWIFWLLSVFSPRLRLLLASTTKRFITSKKAQLTFNWEPISTEKSVIDTSEYVVRTYDI